MIDTALDHFGNFLMTRVRDKVIADWDRILDGRMKSNRAQRVGEQFKRLSDDDRDFVRSVVAQVVDSTLHDLLWGLEGEKTISIAVQTPEGAVTNLAAESDNFPGELYTEDGWIARFSDARRESLT